MPLDRVITIPFRLTPNRLKKLAEEIGVEGLFLTNGQAYYAIRDTVYGWLDGGEADITPLADDDLDDDRAPGDSRVVSDRPYKPKKRLVIRARKKR